MATIPELGNVPSIAGDKGWSEPESAANTSYQPIYPYNDVKQTDAGHLFEMDDTPTRERIRLQHGKTLTFIEFHPNGDQVHKVFGTDYEITIKDKNVLIMANQDNYLDFPNATRVFKNNVKLLETECI